MTIPNLWESVILVLRMIDVSLGLIVIVVLVVPIVMFWAVCIDEPFEAIKAQEPFVVSIEHQRKD